MITRLISIETGFFKLDGGAMFGVIPKVLWQKLESPDENNLCTWAMRCLLAETDDGRRILIDTGIGNKQSAKFFSHYYLHGEHSLHASLQGLGWGTEDVTDVFITHLHFDHVGGALTLDEQGKPRPAFPRARYWSNQKQYDWAYKPNPRERASFLHENFVPLAQEGILQMLPALPYDQTLPWTQGIDVIFVYGHTEAMMLPLLSAGNRKVLYCADLMPSPSHIGLPYVMGYDVRPLDTMTEKAWWLERAAEENWILFFEHAPYVEACTLRREPASGRIVADRQGSLAELLGA